MQQNPRTCVVTRLKLGKTELIRFYVDGNLVKIDSTNSVKSRGFYIAKTPEITYLKFKKAIFRQTKIEVSESLFQEFLKLI